MIKVIQNLLAQIAKTTPLDDVVTAIISSKICSDILFHKDFLDGPCLRLSISKVLGYTMMMGSCLYKLPVLMKIYKVKGGEGISPLSVYLETTAYLASLSYNYVKGNPISTYGDLVASTSQNMLIIFLLWTMGVGKGKQLSLQHKTAAAAGALLFLSLLRYTPSNYQHLIVTYSIVVLILSRLPQIISNFRTRDVGVQSAITWGNAVLGAAAKSYTTLIETRDPLLVGGSLVALVLNAILLTQVLLFKNSHVASLQASKSSSGSKNRALIATPMKETTTTSSRVTRSTAKKR